MTGPRHIVAAATAAALLASGLAACADEEKPGTVPTGTLAPRSPTPTSTEGLTDEQQIRVVYLDYIRRWWMAQDVPRPRRKEYLAQWLTEPLLTVSMRIFDDHEAENWRFSESSSSSERVTQIHVSADSATVRSCGNDSDFYVIDADTGKRMNTPNGEIRYTTTLKKVDGRWRLSENSMQRKPCPAR